MNKRTLWGLVLLIAVILIGVEPFLIARWKTGVFDLRCTFLHGYVIVHSPRPDGKEALRCDRETR